MINQSNYKKEKSKIIRDINKINNGRKKIIKKVHSINKALHTSKISSYKYQSLIKSLLKNKSLTFYLSETSDKLKKLERRLYLIESKLNLNKNKIYSEVAFLVLLTIFSLSYFYLDPSITGLTILDQSLVFNQSSQIDLESNLTSLSLSGYLEGNGSAKIYLGNNLVLDSSQLSNSQTQTTSQNTENVTNNASNLFSIQPVLSQNKIEFNDICIETCNITSIENTEGSNKLNLEITGDLIVTITNTKYNLQINEESKDVEENKSETILENPIENISLSNESLFTIPILNNTLENLTQIENTSSIINNISDPESLTQSSAELNNPVEWKLITLNKTIELPLESSNINVEKIVNETDGTKEKAKLKNLFSSSGIKDKKLIEVDETNETKLEVTYVTKAPYKLESNETSNSEVISKQVTIKSDSELHYSNVLSYTNIPESNTNQIKLFKYLLNNITNESEKLDITIDQIYNVSYEDTNNNSLIDKLIWNTPHLSEENFSVEISLTILTIQSYPTVNGNWTVLFNTTGTADLTITTVNGTTWSQEGIETNSSDDLIFLELSCGNNIQTHTWDNNSVLIHNYSCNETSKEISKVLTTGKHHLSFTFGNITKFAHNLAGVLNLTILSPLNSTATANLSTTLNVTIENNATQFIIYGSKTTGNSTWGIDYNNVLFINQSISGASAYNFTYNFSALPIKPQPDGSDGLVLLHHYDNASSFENYTFAVDFSRPNHNYLNNGTYVRWNSSQQSFGNSTYGRFGNSFLYNGMNNYVLVNNSASLQILNNITLSAWIKFTYNTSNYSDIWTNISSQGIIDKGDYGLYFDHDTGSINFKLDNKSAITNWDIISSVSSYDGTAALKEYNGYLYSGKLLGTGDADIYWCNPNFNTTGDSKVCDPNEWFISYNGGQERLESLEEFNGRLYAGQAIDGGDGDVLVCSTNNTGNISVCDGAADWKTVFDGNSTQEEIITLFTFNGRLYAGQGNGGGDGDVLVCRPNATGDEKVCDSGDWLRSYDANSTQEYTYSLESFNGKLYAGQGSGAGNGDIYVCNSELNTTNLGEGLKECDPDEWSLSYEGAQEFIFSLESFNGKLYAGQGSGSGEGDVYRCDPEVNTTGDKIICDPDEWSLSYDGAQEEMRGLESFNGKLYAGQGSGSGDGDVYVCDPSRNTTGSTLDCDANEWTI